MGCEEKGVWARERLLCIFAVLAFIVILLDLSQLV
jgi:hypothetical protein